MMRRSFAVCTLVVVIATLTAVPTAAAADPVGFITEFGNRAIEVLGPSTSAEQRLSRFREWFRDDFDVAGIGRFVLGRYWRVANPQEQQEFLGLLQEYVAQAYSARLAEFGGLPFRVTGTRPNGEESIVTSEVIGHSGRPTAIDWHLVDRGGRLKITDVNVEGISMKVTERDEFAAVIQRGGGRLDGLLEQLRQKTATHN
jgi:phospholipid transport system substrate-binding protein